MNGCIKITGWTDEITGESFGAEDLIEFDEAVASVDAWYDRHTRLWVIQLLNKDGYQVGDAKYVYGKADAMLTTSMLMEEYGLK